MMRLDEFAPCVVSARRAPGFLGLVSRTTVALAGACALSACSAGAPAGPDGASPPKGFRSPEAASKALVAAAAADDRAAVLELFGSGAADLVDSGDPVEDRRVGQAFAASAQEKLSIEEVDENTAILVTGSDDRTFPIPIVKQGRRWSFDAAAGREELLNRRIGRNEIRAISSCLAYVDAQRDYAARGRKSRDRVEYAQKLRSTPGRRDGLFWEGREGEEPSPLGPLFAAAAGEGFDIASEEQAGQPFHGYHYRVLKAQGPSAPGGRKSYVRGGRMVGGFALVAWPAEHGNSGVMTFVVNQLGVVFQKDLGDKTAEVASTMTEFDPDDSWDAAEPVQVEDDGSDADAAAAE